MDDGLARGRFERFQMPITPRYVECDQQGVVFNAWYLVWWDEAMTAWMRHIGLDYTGLVAAGLDFQNVHTEIDYRSGVRWGEQAVVGVEPRRLGRRSFTIGYTVLRGEQVCVEGHIVYAAVATDGSGSRDVPVEVRALIKERLAPTG